MYFAGIDIGGTNIKMGLVDKNGKVLVSNLFKTGAERGYSAVVNDIVENLNLLCAKSDMQVSDLLGIGIGIPGVTDTQNGVVVSAANIGWHKIALAQDIEKKLGVKCVIGNDANCACLGEQKFGSGKELQNIVFITLGTGIGSGIVIDGKLFCGVGGAGAEAGHMLLMFDGEQCNCGHKGCWERYASVTALIQQTELAIEQNPTSILAKIAGGKDKINGKTVFDAAELGDPVADKVIANYLKYIAEGLISLANLLHPEAFIIGGGISHEGDKIMRPVEKILNTYLEKSGFLPHISVISASLGNTAGLIGAAALVMEN
ncbi:MAG: ROK family protein [Clostridia bacterium]